jgi:predicted kinase/GNAT superfamily N-acetyltransferase
VLVIMGGLPASGKTTLSRGLAQRLGAVHVRLDTIEPVLTASSAFTPPLGPAGYAVAYALAEDFLRQGQAVIADTVNPVHATREAWRGVAARAGVPSVEIEVVCSDPAEQRRRAETRVSDVPGLTLPTWEAIESREYDPWARDHTIVDTAGRAIGECVDHAVASIPQWIPIALLGPEALALIGELSEVYGKAFDDPVEAFVRDQFPRHVHRDGFRCAVARRAGRIIGFAYGYTGERGQWWSDWIAGAAPAAVVDAWIGGHFEFVELAVDPAERGRGVGTALHDRLLHGLPHARALLTTYRDERPATRLYRRRGWSVLVDGVDESSALYGLALG